MRSAVAIRLAVAAAPMLACSQAPPVRRPAAAPPPTVVAVVSPDPAPATPAAPCAPARLEDLRRSDDRSRAIACFRDDQATRDCWSIDPATGAATSLPPAAWPAERPPGYPPGDALAETAVGGVAIRVRPPRTVAIDHADTKTPVVVTCASAGTDCKRVTLRAQAKRTHVLGRIAISDDGSLLTAGFGTELAGDARTELYEVATGTYRTTLEIKMPRVACTDVSAFPSGNLLVQTTDCANHGGVRVVMNPKGGWLATLGEFASGAPIYDLGGDRWLLVDDRLELWSFAKPVRHATLATPPRSVTVAGGAILGVADDGSITTFATTDLATTKLGAIPRCR